MTAAPTARDIELFQAILAWMTIATTRPESPRAAEARYRYKKALLACQIAEEAAEHKESILEFATRITSEARQRREDPPR